MDTKLMIYLANHMLIEYSPLWSNYMNDIIHQLEQLNPDNIAIDHLDHE